MMRPSFKADAFDATAFLRDHWQKQPLLIRNPWTAWTNPLDPDDLAGLACEAAVESRIVRQTRHGLKAEHGPFPEKRFAKLGKRPWTLLVQAVDQYVPEVAALLDAVAFLPRWRIDDVMVSYASVGGGVGAHFDQYDVFLVQGLGQRRWQVGGACDAGTALAAHDDLRLLADFEPVHDWVLDPGDILYLPPRVAHHGVAVGDDCMTYSIGCRAPSRADLLGHWADDLLAGLGDDDRYADPDLAAQANPGEIAPAALARLYIMLTETLADPAAFARWFGRYTSERKYADADAPDAPPALAEVRDRLAAGTALVRNPASRYAFARADAGLTLFVDGEAFDCAPGTTALAENLCAQPRVAVTKALARSGAAIALIANLIAQGSLAFDPDP